MYVKFIPADPDADVEIIDLECTRHTVLIAAKAKIGGWIEMVHTRELMNRQQVLLVDEDGLSKELPVNVRALNESRYPGIIVGDAIICGERYNRAHERTGDLLDYRA